jgi:hypothetical protein
MHYGYKDPHVVHRSIYSPASRCIKWNYQIVRRIGLLSGPYKRVILEQKTLTISRRRIKQNHTATKGLIHFSDYGLSLYNMNVDAPAAQEYWTVGDEGFPLSRRQRMCDGYSAHPIQLQISEFHWICNELQLTIIYRRDDKNRLRKVQPEIFCSGL